MGGDARPGGALRPREAADFEGLWRLDRRIVQAEGPDARFHGEAEWRREGVRLLYSEAGILEMPGHPPMQATRSYLWEPDLTVRFTDGRVFHRVPARGGRTAHRCAPDLYEVEYDFALWPEFRVLWRVTGPRKDYTMTSLYRRA